MRILTISYKNRNSSIIRITDAPLLRQIVRTLELVLGKWKLSMESDDAGRQGPQETDSNEDMVAN